MTGTASGRVAYLDNAATTPLRAEVLDAMMPWLTTVFGNASAGHSMARAARRAVEDARDCVAEVLGGDPGEVVFTSGGTEADNLAITGTAVAARESGARATLIGCSTVEHPAVLEPVRAARGEMLPVDGEGSVELGYVEEWISSSSQRVAEVSVMLVNNETGVVQDLSAVARLVHDGAPGALVHTDAVQALGWLDVSFLAADADLISISAHKLGGPQGTGALLVRSRARRHLRPIMRGGPQERELRAGTHHVAGIVGMACAARLCSREREDTCRRVGDLADTLVAGVLGAVAGSGTAVPAARRISAICNLWFDGVSAEELLLVLDDLGVCASAGSACASGAIVPSHVLLAMGRTAEEARRHIRLSLGHATTLEDVQHAVVAITAAVAQLRGGC